MDNFIFFYLIVRTKRVDKFGIRGKNSELEFEFRLFFALVVTRMLFVGNIGFIC